MKILLDHNLDHRLKKHLPGHEISTTHEQGWADVTNGKLLTLAEENHFEVLLTADSNIKNQQKISERNIAVIILRAFNNRIATHIDMVEDIKVALSEFSLVNLRGISSRYDLIKNNTDIIEA